MEVEENNNNNNNSNRNSNEESRSKMRMTEINTSQIYKTNWLHSMFTLMIWISTIHFICLLLLYCLFFLPFSNFLIVYGLLVVFALIPINEGSDLGRRLCRKISGPACSYFPITLHVEDINAFNSDRAYVFGYEPHSLFPLGVSALLDNLGFMPLPKIKVLASSAVFRTPFIRHLWTWGGLSSASRENFTSLLASGYSCIVIPGGLQEIFHMKPDSEIAFLKARRGFVQLSIQMGTPLVPVFCFGQSKTYRWWKPKGKLIWKFARAIKFPLVIFWGVLGGPLPFKHPMHVVVGTPIEVKQNPEPTMEEVMEVHGQFVAALKDLFERHKASLGYPDLTLEIL